MKSPLGESTIPYAIGSSSASWSLHILLDELQPFARDCGWHGAPFRWDEGRRFLIRCEIDAAFFLLYLRPGEDGRWCQVSDEISSSGEDKSERHSQISRYFPSPRDGLAYIMDTFDKVRAIDESRNGEYRTKRVILEIYHAMQAAAASGDPYRTVLDPPPADRSCCHPPRGAVVDLASLDDGNWVRPEGDPTGAETAVLAAVLKAIGGPAAARTVRLTVLLAMEPRWLTPSLSPDDAGHWERLVGPEASAHDSTAEPLGQLRVGHRRAAATRNGTSDREPVGRNVGTWIGSRRDPHRRMARRTGGHGDASPAPS